MVRGGCQLTRQGTNRALEKQNPYIAYPFCMEAGSSMRSAEPHTAHLLQHGPNMLEHTVFNVKTAHITV